MNLKLTLEYDGTDFLGWARQPGVRTVEGVVRDAFDAVFPRWDGLAVAGRHIRNEGVDQLARGRREFMHCTLEGRLVRQRRPS